MTESETAPPSRLGRWLAWIGVVLVVVIVAGAAVLSGRPWIAAAAVLGVLGAWVARLVRRHPVTSIAILLGLLVGAGLASIAVFTPFAGSPPPSQISVRYEGTGQ